MRYVTRLACEHSCPLPSNLNKYTKQLDYLTIRTSSLKQLDTSIRTTVHKQLDCQLSAQWFPKFTSKYRESPKAYE
jgi:hypothetical protein